MASIIVLNATLKGLRRLSLANPWLPRSTRIPSMHELQLHALVRLIECTCPPPSARGMPGNLRAALKRLHGRNLGRE